MRSISLIYGENHKSIAENSSYILKDSEISIFESDFACFINNTYNTGLPTKFVWYKQFGIIIHGIVFPKDYSIDEFADNSEIILQQILANNINQIERIPYSFSNGSFVVIVVNRKKGELFAFTSFGNSIPFYYSLYNNSIILSTDFNTISKIVKGKLSEITVGLMEYYQFGTIFSNKTVIDDINSISKGSYLNYNRKNQINQEYYYIMPNEGDERNIDEIVDEFREIWERSLLALSSKKFRIGLGFTGGIDSRIIMAGWPDRSKLFYFTGSNKHHPDYILASKIINKNNLNKFHSLENYSQTNILVGYFEYLKYCDNPLLVNSLVFKEQLDFRDKNKLTFELHGLTEFIGGVYHYSSRKSIKGLLESILPLRLHKLKNQTFEDNMILLKDIVRGNMFDELITKIKDDYLVDKFTNHIMEFTSKINVQINVDDYKEKYLERFRSIYKFENLLANDRLGGRHFVELLSPSQNNLELTDFTCKIPIRQRDSRKILLKYLKKYYPELSNVVLSNNIFSPKAPWIFHKIIAPLVKVFNHLGYYIPILQWYMRANKFSKINFDEKEYARLQVEICKKSDFINNTVFKELILKYKDDKIRRSRIFNIALLEKRITMQDNEYEDYLNSIIEQIRT